MDRHDPVVRDRGQAFGIAGLIAAVLCVLASAVGRPPFNLYVGGLACLLAAIAALHGERTHAIIAPVAAGVGLFLFNTFTVAAIWLEAQFGRPGPLLLALSFLAAPFIAIAFDNAQREAMPGPSVLLKELRSLASRFGSGYAPTPPAASARAKLSLVPQASGQPYSASFQDLVRGRTITLGRKSTSDVVLNDDSVSRQHARIAYVEGLGTAICDLGSVNGTYVSGQRISSQYVPLAGVKTIRLGKCDVDIELPGGQSER